MMLNILKNIFGNAITEKEYSFPSGTPIYIRYGYHVSHLFFHNITGLLIQPNGESWNLSSLKKHTAAIEKLCREPVILGLNRMTALQRTNLIESGIAFVCPQGQVFVPFWGCYFEERILNPPEPASVMTANAQLVFLYMYYHQDSADQSMNQTQIAKALHLGKSTCTRAVQLLHGLELVTITENGTANLVSLSQDRSLCLAKAFPFMTSPVQRSLYVKTLPANIPCKLSSLKALSQMSMIHVLPSDAGYAISKGAEKLLRRDSMLDEQTFRDFGGEVIEIWKYDPACVSETSCVDEISLLLIFKDETDERVQKELDAIREKHELSGDA